MKFLRWAHDHGLESVAVILFAALIALTLSQVAARYLFHFSISFSEEMARFLFIWISFLGAAIVMKHDEHIRLDLLQDKLSPRIWSVLYISVYAAIIVFNLLVLIYSFPLIETAADQPAPVSRLPMGWVYAILPILAVFSIYFCCEHIIRTAKSFRMLKDRDE